MKRLLTAPPPPRVFINAFRYVMNQYLWKRTVLAFHPLSVVLYLTKRCNYRCSFCYAENVLNNKNVENDLTLEQLRELMATSYGKNALRVGLLGGEPFMNGQIFEILEELKKHRKIVTIVSNASLIGEAEIARLNESKFGVLGLSLYANNRRHVERVVRGIDGKLKYWVQTVITPKTIGEMESILEFAVSIGCENLLFSNCIPIGDMSDDEAIYEDDEQYLETERRLREKFVKRINIGWVQLLPRRASKRACAMPFSYVHVDNKGNLGACCMRAPDGKRFGNIYDDPHAWNQPYYQTLRKSMQDVTIPPLDVCKGCDNFYHDLYHV